MKSLTSSALADRLLSLWILPCIELFARLPDRGLGTHHPRVFRPNEIAPQGWPIPFPATPMALQQGCAADLGTFLRRMEYRFDALVEPWLYDAVRALNAIPGAIFSPVATRAHT